MLKSLGQWTAASRKIIPSQLPAVPSKSPSSDKEQEEFGKQEESEYVFFFEFLFKKVFKNIYDM